jgi:hypothetical protein
VGCRVERANERGRAGPHARAFHLGASERNGREGLLAGSRERPGKMIKMINVISMIGIISVIMIINNIECQYRL